MNLVIRFLMLYFQHLIGRKPAHILDTTERTFRVWITDQDAFLHMNNGRYMAISDLAGIDFMMRVGIWRAIRSEGWIPVIVHKDISIHKMLKFPQKFTVRTKTEYWDDTYACVSHEFWRKGRLHAEGKSIMRFVGAKGERPSINDMTSLIGLAETPVSPPITPAFAERLSVLEAAKPVSDLPRLAEAPHR